MIFIPFGFHPRLILNNFSKYFYQLIWPYIIIAGFSFIFLIIKLKVTKNKEFKRRWKYYLLSLLIIFPIILIYYGSWDIADLLVKKLNIISISYVRYFIPLFILILPLSSLVFNILLVRGKGLNKIYNM